MAETFHVDAKKTVNFRSVRNAANQQRFCLDRKDPHTGTWERMGEEFYHNDRQGSFPAISESTDWRITLQNDNGSSNWGDSKVEESGDGTGNITYRADDSGWAPDGDYDDLIVYITLT